MISWTWKGSFHKAIAATSFTFPIKPLNGVFINLILLNLLLIKLFFLFSFEIVRSAGVSLVFYTSVTPCPFFPFCLSLFVRFYFNFYIFFPHPILFFFSLLW